MSMICNECWNRRRDKKRLGIEDVQCPGCGEFFEMAEPLPDRYTCPYCGTTFSLDGYDSNEDEIEELKRMLR
jgi:hypothetical protein